MAEPKNPMVLRSAAEVYMTAIERGLLTRLDHAAYLGRELARAEHAMSSGNSLRAGRRT